MHSYKKIILFFAMGILVILVYLNYDVGIPCFFYELTGFYCPGCGITRCFLSLLQLDIYQAFRYNMLVIIFIPFLVAYQIYKIIFKGTKQIPNWVWSLLLIFTISFGVLRNIPALSFLAPTLIR